MSLSGSERLGPIRQVGLELTQWLMGLFLACCLQQMFAWRSWCWILLWLASNSQLHMGFWQPSLVRGVQSIGQLLLLHQLLLFFLGHFPPTFVFLYGFSLLLGQDYFSGHYWFYWCASLALIRSHAMLTSRNLLSCNISVSPLDVT